MTNSDPIQTAEFPADMGDGGGFDLGLFGWDNLAMQITENFAFDTDDAAADWGQC